MSGYTPGPWEIEFGNEGEPNAIVPSGGRLSVACNCRECATYSWGGRTYHEIVTCDSHVYGPSLQDARLIIAAPDLLAALKRMVETFPPTREEWTSDAAYAKHCREFSEWTAAIAKAEGVEPEHYGEYEAAFGDLRINERDE